MAERSRERSGEIERLRSDNAALRRTIETLQSTIADLKAIICSLESQLGAQKSAFEDQKVALEKALAELQSLQRRLLGPKSEKMPPPKDEIRRRRGENADPTETEAKRRANAERKAEVPTRTIPHRVPDEERICPKCKRTDLTVVGPRTTTMWEYVPGYFEQHVHVQEALVCPCGEYAVMAPCPDKPFENARHGPNFIAHLIVSKCLDAIPIHRLEKQFDRLGIPMSRSTMNDLFHHAAELLRPLVDRLFALIALAPVVQADETSIKIQTYDKRGFIWTFVTEQIVAFRFSPNRSGDTPKAVLDGTEGVLVVDAYTGYNRVTNVKGRRRAGCLAHSRRRFFDALEFAPEAKQALEIILDVYEVEHDAEQLGIKGTAEHLRLRQQRAGPVMARLKEWLLEQKPLHPPKSCMGTAISYALKNWDRICVFLEDARVPVDNNASERALRAAALGRKNFLFVGNVEAGEHLAVLYSLTATCVANGVNPQEYLADVLLRIHSHPAPRIDELLPQNWVPLPRANAA